MSQPRTVTTAPPLPPETLAMIGDLEAAGRIVVVAPGPDGEPQVLSYEPTQPFDAGDAESALAALPAQARLQIEQAISPVGYLPPPAQETRVRVRGRRPLTGLLGRIFGRIPFT